MDHSPKSPQKAKSEIIQKLPVSKTDQFSTKKIATLKYFETLWAKKPIKEVLGEYIHMFLIAKDYRDYKKKSLATISPKKYQHAFKSLLEFARDRGNILRKILKSKSIKFTQKGNLIESSLNNDLKKFIHEQIHNNKMEPNFIMTESLDKAAKREYQQSQYLYELLPYITKLPAIEAVIKKLEAKLGKKVFLFLGTIQNMKIKDTKYFVFDIDFCTSSKPKPYDAYYHEEFRKFHYPFWISTGIIGNKLEILVRSLENGKDKVLLKETYNLDKFKNYTKVFDYISKKIISEGLVDKMPKSK